MELTSVVGFTKADKRKIITIGPPAMRWPWWAMFPRMEKPTHRIKAVSPTVAVLGKRRKRGWLV